MEFIQGDADIFFPTDFWLLEQIDHHCSGYTKETMGSTSSKPVKRRRTITVVITKCFHPFCHTCIQRNLEIRHCKCPGCGIPFGQSDVREVNI